MSKEFVIIWSDFAEKQLDEIYEYYQQVAGSRIASKLLKGIIEEPKQAFKKTIYW